MNNELALLNRAASQEGLLTLADVMALVPRALLRWRVATKRWRRLWPRVYLVTGSPPTRAQRLRGVRLWLGRHFAFSHATAAGLYGFRGYEDDGVPEVTIARRLRPRNGVRVHRVKTLPKDDVTKQGALPLTTVERTVIDLAWTEKELRKLVDALLARKLTTVDALELALRRVDRKGKSPLWSVLDAYRGGDAPAESELEQVVLALLRKSGLPMPRKQSSLRIAGRQRRVDFLFADFGVVLETDGYLTHSTAEAFEADRERQNALSASGLTVLRWTWKAVRERPDELIAQLRETFRARTTAPS
jgi:very-short-patch-repair endonuclease